MRTYTITEHLNTKSERVEYFAKIVDGTQFIAECLFDSVSQCQAWFKEKGK